MATARVRLATAENWYRPAVTKKSPAQNIPVATDPKNVTASTVRSGAGPRDLLIRGRKRDQRSGYTLARAGEVTNWEIH
jgi:hypothetical protein